MTYGIIYVVENTINGKKYVGQTVQPLKVRWQRHCRKEQSGCVALASAIAKYGADAFKVSEVAQASTKEELNSLEAQLVVALGTVAPGGYNLRSGGGSKGRHSSGSKEKMAVAHRSPENMEIHAAQSKARWQNEGYRAKMIAAVKSFWANTDNKESASKKMRESFSNPSVQKKKSVAMKARYQNPENLEKHRLITSSEQFKEKVSAASKKHWEKQDYREKQRAHRVSYWDANKRAEFGERSAKFLSNPDLPPRADNTTGYRGVKKISSGRFVARVIVHKKEKQIGVYDTAAQAHEAYVECKRQMVLNLVD